MKQAKARQALCVCLKLRHCCQLVSRRFGSKDSGRNEERIMDRPALFESALDSLPDGIALLDCDGGVSFWNQAAEAITGYTASDLVAQAVPDSLKPLLQGCRNREAQAGVVKQGDRGVLVRARHKLGHEIPAITRILILRDGLGERVGTAALFHPAERLDALPHGESGDELAVPASQAEIEERLQSEFEDFGQGGEALGILWIAVDQGPELRKTHGIAASQAMLEKMQRTLAQALRPAEELGRWGDDEFLVIAHERTQEMLAGRARTLAGVARTADFHWWGDRVSLTVSIGVAHARLREPLPELLHRAQEAMETSAADGGNRVTFA
jgi:diguanylate cyclase (GGDEF)-like protein/PAS domain S-box-containing protein